ncbi:MAG: glucose-6-phosphate dehydrogenase [Spirochaetales bacterium]|nr:glucose-6-phosphate dehydrogenase [Spirochaetales bacterium]
MDLYSMRDMRQGMLKLDTAGTGQRVDATVVLLGGTGDLATRRVAPALWKLWLGGQLGRRFRLVGMARRELDDQGYRALLDAAIRASLPAGMPGDPARDGFLDRVSYLRGDVSDPAPYAALARLLADPSENALFYLACTPDRFGDAASRIAEAGLAGTNSGTAGWRRLAVEKPFGTDLPSARALNQLLHERYDEDDILRVDHYLGKEAVQNILYFRFYNAIFEPLWNRKHIERVEISATETGGIGDRGGYYDDSGAARDMLQNHLMQLFCLVAMEPPGDFSPEAVRDAKVRLLRSVPHAGPLEAPLDCVRGQYAQGTDGPAYLDEQRVRPGSTTETFVAARLTVDNWRWKGVPFILKTGKALAERACHIVVHFRKDDDTASEANRLLLSIQPDQRVVLTINAKTSGGDSSEREELVGALRDTAGAYPDAYERILGDALRGYSQLFIRFDEAEEAWRLVQPFLEYWKRHPSSGLALYPAGGNGPDLGALYRPDAGQDKAARGA